MQITYRKMQNGTEFMKVVNNEKVLSVTNGKHNHRVMASTNPMYIDDCLDDEVSMASTKEEFTQALYNATLHIADIDLARE